MDQRYKPRSIRTKQERSLRLIYFNARSLISKIDDLNCVIDSYSPDLILVCETWLNSSINPASFYIPGYNVNNDLRLDKTTNERGIGGGLIIYSKNGLRIS